MLRGATRSVGADGMNTTENRIGGCRPTVASDLMPSTKSKAANAQNVKPNSFDTSAQIQYKN
jgi:hypothetical protein